MGAIAKVAAELGGGEGGLSEFESSQNRFFYRMKKSAEIKLAIKRREHYSARRSFSNFKRYS